MNLAPHTHLAWKEYRAIRGFWIALVLLACGLMLVSRWLVDPGWLVNSAFNLALAMPAFFALGCAGTAFALEKEEGTFDWLRAAPLTSRQVLTSKLALVITGAVALGVALVTMALAVTGGVWPEPLILSGMLGLWPLAAVEALAWGTLFSLHSSRPLVATCLALFAASSSIHLLAWSSPSTPTSAWDFVRYADTVPRRLILLLPLLAVDVYLGWRWLENRDPPRTKRALRRARLDDLADGRADDRTGAPRSWLARRDRAAMLGHLLWQHFRQSGWLMLVLAVVHVAATLVIMFSGIEQQTTNLAIIPMAIGAGLMGACVFYGDQQGRQYRFFVEHNVPPRSVWATRLVPWVVVLMISSAVIFAFWLRDLWPQLLRVPDHYRSYHLPMWKLGAATMVVSFAAGQWASMLVRSGLMAGFFGLLLAALVCGWAALLLFMQISWFWTVAPIAITLIAATGWRSPDWIEEHTTWPARAKAAAALLIPALAIVATLALFRVTQVPSVAEPPRPSFAVTPAGLETADMYRRASELYLERQPRLARTAKENRKSWLEENAEPLALVLDAAARNEYSPFDPNTSDGVPPVRQDKLMSLVTASARDFQSQNKFDEALDRYFVALDVLSQWSRYPGVYAFGQASAVLDELPHWAAHQGQSVERIRKAIVRLEAFTVDKLHPTDPILALDAIDRRFVRGGEPPWHNHPDLTELLLWRDLMPWERYRSVRLLNLMTGTALERVAAIEQELSTGNGIVAYLPWRQDEQHFFEVAGSSTVARALSDMLSTTPPCPPGVGWEGLATADGIAQFVSHNRAAQIAMALHAYRREHDTWPESLSALTPAYFPTVPRDPYSGLDFVYFSVGPPEPRNTFDVRAWEAVGKKVARGKPCLWSSGRNLLVVRDIDAQELPDRQPGDVAYYNRRDIELNLLATPLRGYDAWQLGEWLPIPEPQP